ncbi:cyanophycin synthetase family protein [Arabiibacter massiliensis]|uniref:cyanophycin synthetase family protein n=1 Tax=Arabiibacter massiliensis TaxID=1870985 RepID=UPI0009BC56AD|nr:hypothetical protein [Arabiibacter massiliensis]
MSDAAPALSVERLVVRSGRVACDVLVAPGAPRMTTPALAARVRADFPDLPRHACVNEVGDTFAAVMDRTSLPHLLEHLVIDLQTRSAASCGQRARDAVYVGTTEWTDEQAGRACVQVSFTDDLIALRAFRDAVDYLNAVVVP